MSFLVWQTLLPPFLALYFVFIWVNYVWPRFRRPSIRHIRGPPNTTWLIGNKSLMYWQDNVGDVDFPWLKEYGKAFRIKGAMGDYLLIADPKALQYMLHTSGYNYGSYPAVQDFIQDLLGKGIVWATGTTHQRQRRLLNQMFTSTQLKAFLPIFEESGSRLCQKLKDLVDKAVPVVGQSSSNSKTTAGVVNVAGIIPKATLEALGDAIFDYRLHALEEDKEEPLSKDLGTLFIDAALYPTKVIQVMAHLQNYHPGPILEIIRRIPTRQRKRFNQFKNIANQVAARLLDERYEQLRQGHGELMGGDGLSILVRANMAEVGEAKLNDDELRAQMATLLLGGGETSANTLSWVLYELSRHPDVQSRVRDEVMCSRAGAGASFKYGDLEKMPFLSAVLKETLRLHPITFVLERQSFVDDIIPLSEPILDRNGRSVSEIAVGKGQKILFNVAGYNRLTDVWGSDAHEFNPDRFMGEDAVTEKGGRIKLGVTSNILSFGGGVKSCIAWRFAMHEMQIMLAQMVEAFEFAPDPHGTKICRAPSVAMQPMIEGKPELGSCLPLLLTPPTQSMRSKNLELLRRKPLFCFSANPFLLLFCLFS